jgi:hypothetical protein
MTNLDTVLTRIAEQLAEMGLRVAELEADLVVERERRAIAERQLHEKIEDEGREKFNANLGNAVDIDQLEGRIGIIEHALGRSKPPRRVVFMPFRSND